MRLPAVMLCLALLAGCGAPKAVRETGGLFDKYACLSRDFKGQPSCQVQPPRP